MFTPQALWLRTWAEALAKLSGKTEVTIDVPYTERFRLFDYAPTL